MKLIRATREKLLFQLVEQEKFLLCQTLGLYPLVPLAHHRLSKDAELPNQAENQALLEQMLQLQRRENQKLVTQFLADADRFKPLKKGLQLVVALSEVEWLLQVLNDVRVGSWLALGSPDGELEERALAELDSEAARHHLMMNLACAFEIYLLEALGKT